MKKRKKNAPQNPLSSWEVDVPIPRDFQAGVWAKIADQRTAQNKGFRFELGQWLQRFLAHPMPAAALAGVVLLIGFGGGQLQGSVEAQRSLSSMEERYTSSLDPYIQAKISKKP